VSRSLRVLPGAAVAWLVMRPRRRPRLDRVTRTAAFRTHRAAAAAWVDRQFRLIESAAPWLERTGVAVEDLARRSLAHLVHAHGDGRLPGPRRGG
jgi:hypothetical protein